MISLIYIYEQPNGFFTYIAPNLTKPIPKVYIDLLCLMREALKGPLYRLWQWKEHMSYVSRKGYKSIGIISKVRKYLKILYWICIIHRYIDIFHTATRCGEFLSIIHELLGEVAKTAVRIISGFQPRTHWLIHCSQISNCSNVRLVNLCIGYVMKIYPHLTPFW